MISGFGQVWYWCGHSVHILCCSQWSKEFSGSFCVCSDPWKIRGNTGYNPMNISLQNLNVLLSIDWYCVPEGRGVCKLSDDCSVSVGCPGSWFVQPPKWQLWALHSSWWFLRADMREVLFSCCARVPPRPWSLQCDSRKSTYVNNKGSLFQLQGPGCSFIQLWVTPVF